jgi:hypothetical protein
MTSPEIPARVLQFLAERIDSVPQLEAVLLLWEDPQRLWSEEELAGRIYVGRQDAATILQSLQRQQLVTSEPAAAVRYRYNPQWDPTGEVMPEGRGQLPASSGAARHVHSCARLDGRT